MIDKIYLKNNNGVFKQYFNATEKELTLKKVNIFVGANNSGKSRLMREIFLSLRSREVKEPFASNDINFPFIESKTVLSEYNKFEESYLKLVLDKGSIGKEKLHLKKIKDLLKPDLQSAYFSFNKYTEIFKDFNFRKDGFAHLSRKHNDKFELFKKLRASELENISYSTYIPVLRTLKKIESSLNNPLTERIERDYFKMINKKHNIFNGENLYDYIKKLLGSGEPKRKIVSSFSKFLNDSFFHEFVGITPLDILGEDKDGKDILNKNKDLYIKIGDEEERPIYSIGDGIQALIILTFPLFLNQDKNHILFIEEPELNLHPGLQRIFLDVISSDKFPNTQVFITTHSNHFLDMAIETKENIEVYAFQKEVIDQNSKFRINNITQSAFDALDLLGVQTSSVFLSNCTIWIEGISERLYFRHYLKLYNNYLEKVKNDDENKNYKEDIHYSFVEYSGNNIKHWSFFDNEDEEPSNINYESISRNVLVISDNDNKEEKHKLLKEKLGDNYFPLKCNEIENLLMPDVLKKTVIEFKYIKAEINSKSFTIGNFNDYKNKPIGEYIYEKFIKDKELIKKSLLTNTSEKATRKILDKKRFTKNAIKHIKKWDDLSEEAQELTKFIHVFIKKNNEPKLTN